MTLKISANTDMVADISYIPNWHTRVELEGVWQQSSVTRDRLACKSVRPADGNCA